MPPRGAAARPGRTPPQAGEAAAGAGLAGASHWLSRKVAAAIRHYRGPSFFEAWSASDAPPIDEEGPQRYRDQRQAYLDRGGLLRPEALVGPFTAGHAANRGDMVRFFFLCQLHDQLAREGLRGDVAELGVYKGNTASILAVIARQMGTTAWLFDTFEGFDPADLAGIDSGKRPEFADTSLEGVRRLVGDESVRFVPGRFPDTADAVPEERRFALVHVDCDLYAPFRAALEFFYPRLLPGGFLVLHDYASLHWNGAERAADEFFADKPEFLVPLPDGSGTAVVRRSGQPDRYAHGFAQARVSGFNRQWQSAGEHGGLADCLLSGWTSPEAWGTWGVGGSHVLALHLAHPPAGDLELDCDVHAFLGGTRQALSVQVLVDGRALAHWQFDEARNNGVRSVRIPAGLASSCAAQGSLPVVPVEFRPGEVASPHALDPANPERRPLGLGLSRARLCSLPPADPADAPAGHPAEAQGA